MPKRRPKKKRGGSKRDETLAPEWRTWAAENLARGAPRATVEATLRENGVPAAEAKRRVDEILLSPGLAVARRAEAETEKLRQVVRLLREQQRVAGTEVPRVAGIDADDFYVRWYATNTPVILTDYVTRWPAFGMWSPEHFAERLGDVEVKVAEGREADPDYDMHTDRHTVTTTMCELAERVISTEASNDFYMVAQNRNLEDERLAALFDDLPLDLGILDPEKRVGACQLWFGPRGTVTPLHHDTSNILFCQVYGEKRIRLASPLETELLEGARAMYSAIDPTTDPETNETDVPFFDVTLVPGEALFIPVGWWHHVVALSASISVALNCFARDNDRRWYCPGALPKSAV